MLMHFIQDNQHAKGASCVLDEATVPRISHVQREQAIRTLNAEQRRNRGVDSEAMESRLLGILTKLCDPMLWPLLPHIHITRSSMITPVHTPPETPETSPSSTQA